MPPVVALDLGNRGDVSGAESRCTAGKNDENQGKDQEGRTPAYSERGHGRRALSAMTDDSKVRIETDVR